MLETIKYLINNAFVTNKKEIVQQIAEGNITHYGIKCEQAEIAGNSFRGKRKAQEDRIDVAEVPDFQLLTSAQQNHVINKTVADLQYELRNYKPGSCLLTSIIFPVFDQDKQLIAHHIVTINLGDSESILVEENHHDTFIEILNTSHRLPESSCIEEISKKYDLNIERTFGDKNFPKVIRIADITHKTVKFENETNILIVCSDGVEDGLYNRKQLENKIKEIVTLHRYSPTTISQKITDAAWQYGSADNISVLVAALNDKIDRPYALSVFDGHGGHEAAQYLAENFIKRLTRNVQAELALGPEPEHLVRDSIAKKKQTCIKFPKPVASCLEFLTFKEKSPIRKNPPFTEAVSQQRKNR